MLSKYRFLKKGFSAQGLKCNERITSFQMASRSAVILQSALAIHSTVVPVCTIWFNRITAFSPQSILIGYVWFSQ
jgi:hypothetical protein